MNPVCTKDLHFQLISIKLQESSLKYFLVCSTKYLNSKYCVYCQTSISNPCISQLGEMYKKCTKLVSYKLHTELTGFLNCSYGRKHVDTAFIDLQKLHTIFVS